MVNITIMNETGHTEMAGLLIDETIEVINNHPTHWLFIDGVATARTAINTIEWEEVSNVELAFSIVGGN